MLFERRKDRKKEEKSEMFVMKKVGRRISELRKRKNMTQLELADRMGISFQAVSNWERGNSMPDISKLPELAEILGTSIDDIIGGKSPLIENAAEGTLEDYIENNPVSLEEIKEAAPVLKPSQMVVIADKNVKVIAKGASGKLTVNGKTYDLDKPDSIEADGKQIRWVQEKEEPSENFSDSRQESDTEGRSQGGDSILSGMSQGDIEELLPYLNDDAAEKLIRMLQKDGRDISHLLPLIDDDVAASMAIEMYNQGGLDSILTLLDDIDEDTLSEIAAMEAEKNGFGAIIPMIQYIDEDLLGEIALKEARKNGVEEIIPFMNRFDEDVAGEIAAMEADKNGLNAIIPMAQYIDEDVLAEIVLKHYSADDIDGLIPFINYLDEDAVSEIAIEIIKTRGLKAAKSILPYADEDAISEFINNSL